LQGRPFLFEAKRPKQQREGSIISLSLKEERRKDMKAISTLCAFQKKKSTLCKLQQRQPEFEPNCLIPFV
jgi:hypothetical protein